MTTTEAQEVVNRTHRYLDTANARAQETGLPRGLAMRPRLFPGIWTLADFRYWQARHMLRTITDAEFQDIQNERAHGAR